VSVANLKIDYFILKTFVTFSHHIYRFNITGNNIVKPPSYLDALNAVDTKSAQTLTRNFEITAAQLYFDKLIKFIKKKYIKFAINIFDYIDRYNKRHINQLIQIMW